jgi:hypothetical protein
MSKERTMNKENVSHLFHTRLRGRFSLTVFIEWE